MSSIFKRSIIIVIFLFVFCVSKNVNAMDAYFVWEKTKIDVPVGSSIDIYKNDYQVKFYVNGKESKNFKVEKEVNCSTFSTVLTNKIGQYTVYYKAYSDKYYVSSTQAIVFNVIDTTAPKIVAHDNVVILNHGEELVYTDWFNITDDTCSYETLLITLKDENVHYNMAGEYDAKIVVADLYNNISNQDFKIRIIDKQKPEILIVQPLVIECGVNFNVYEYFCAIDKCCGDITNLIKVDGLDINKIGIQEVSVSVSDFSNNLTTIKVMATVVDNLAPEIIFTSNEITLDILEFSQIDRQMFKQYILDISDNYTKKQHLIVEIDYSNLEEAVSDYEVFYTVIDESNNKTTRSVIVKLRELVGPELKVDSNINIKIGEELDLLSLVEVVDLYDLTAKNRLTILESNFNPNAAGNYTVTYICYNNSGKYTTKTITINVVEDEVLIKPDEDINVDYEKESDNKFEFNDLKINKENIKKVAIVFIIVVLVILLFRKKKNK